MTGRDGIAGLGGAGRALVIGYGLTGRSAASWLAGQGFAVVVLEDSRQAGTAALAAVTQAAATSGGGAGTGSVEVEIAPARRERPSWLALPRWWSRAPECLSGTPHWSPPSPRA